MPTSRGGSRRPFPFLLLIALVAGVSAATAPRPAAAETLPPAGSIEEARERLGMLRRESGAVEAWVDAHLDEEFARRYPAESRAPQGAKEPVAKYREREMRARKAVSELKSALRAERKAWLESEKGALLAGEIREDLAVRQGPYDAERGDVPILLGFGWPAGLQIRFRVREKEKEIFDIRFPRAFPARFRIDEKGEVTLLGLDKGKITAETAIAVAPAGPRLLWQGSHDSWVTSVAFGPDGGQVLSAGADGTLIAWDAESGNVLYRLRDVEMALSIAFSPDGKSFATGATDAAVRLRDAETGKEIWSRPGAGMVFSVAFSADGRYIASGDDGGAVRVLGAETGKEVISLDLGSSVRAVSFTPGGDRIVAGCEGGSVVLWERGILRTLWRKDVGGSVYALSVSPAGGGVAVGGGGARIVALELNDGGEMWGCPADGEIRAVRFDTSGRLLATGGSGYTASILEGSTGVLLWKADIGSPVRSLAFGPSGMKLAVGSSDFGVRLFDVVEGNRVVAAYGPSGRIYVDRDRAPRIFQR